MERVKHTCPVLVFWPQYEWRGTNAMRSCFVDTSRAGHAHCHFFFTECKIRKRRAEASWVIWKHRAPHQVAPSSQFTWTQVSVSIKKLFSHQRSGWHILSGVTYLWPTILWWLFEYGKRCKPLQLLLQNPLLHTIIDSLDLLFAT